MCTVAHCVSVVNTIVLQLTLSSVLCSKKKILYSVNCCCDPHIGRLSSRVNQCVANLTLEQTTAEQYSYVSSFNSMNLNSTQRLHLKLSTGALQKPRPWALNKQKPWEGNLGQDQTLYGRNPPGKRRRGDKWEGTKRKNHAALNNNDTQAHFFVLI